jgi:hypothetical protein
VLLAELRALLDEAEAWVRAEAAGEGGAEAAVGSLREALLESPVALERP